MVRGLRHLLATCAAAGALALPLGLLHNALWVDPHFKYRGDLPVWPAWWVARWPEALVGARLAAAAARFLAGRRPSRGWWRVVGAAFVAGVGTAFAYPGIALRASGPGPSLSWACPYQLIIYGPAGIFLLVGLPCMVWAAAWSRPCCRRWRDGWDRRPWMANRAARAAEAAASSLLFAAWVCAAGAAGAYLVTENAEYLFEYVGLGFHGPCWSVTLWGHGFAWGAGGAAHVSTRLTAGPRVPGGKP